jgi:ABC-type antimicrobial peptide transport system permease subunit
MAEQRVKEIGVRKVLGASVSRLWGLLSRDFVVLVAISFLLAAPLAWDVMQRWLLKYQYRVQISWWVFAATMGVAMAITLATVSWQAVRAARANPVKALRSE